MGVEAAYDAGWLYIQAGVQAGCRLQTCRGVSILYSVTVCTVVCNVIVLLQCSG